MNIQEAINSCKRYRRKGELGWYDAVEDFPNYVFCTRDVLAEDWEVEEKSVTITQEDFFHAYTEALKETEIKDTYHIGEVINCLAKRLGL